MNCLQLLWICISLTGQIQASQKTPETPPAQPSRQTFEGLQLLLQGDRQADDGNINQAQITYQAAMEKLLPNIRHKPFKNTVKRDETRREKLGQVLVEEWEKEVTPKEFQLDEATWKVMDLIPQESNLKSAYIQLLTEEVAAFYDPKTKTMHLIREPENKDREKPKKPASLLDMLMGQKDGFDKQETQGVIAHELTHALDDQHFDLDAISNAVKDDDDAALAVSSLFEGEATLTMMAVQQGDWTGSQIVATPAEGLNRVMRLLSPLMPMAGGETARKSPPVMNESLIFPYLQGVVFCASLTNKGGWDALNQAYENPPISTEQILHPEKYQGPKSDWPIAIQVSPMQSPEGFNILGNSVIGELTTRILLGRFGGRNAAAGWGGDTLTVLQSKTDSKKLACAWMTTWDSIQDAREFTAGIAQRWATKTDQDSAPTKPIQSDVKIKSESLHIVLRGKDVLVIRGLDPKTSQSFSDSIWPNVRKTPKTFHWPAAQAKSRPNP